MDMLYKIVCGDQEEELIATSVVSNGVPISSIRVEYRFNKEQSIKDRIAIENGLRPSSPLSKIYIHVSIDNKKFKGKFAIVKDVVNVAWLIKEKDKSNWIKGFKSLFG